MTTSTRMDDRLIDVPRGLANVVVTETELSDVRGHEGFYHYRQYPATSLAETRSVEDVWRLLLDGELPTPGESASFRAEVAARRGMSAALSRILPSLVEPTPDGTRPAPLSALRAALAIEGAQRGLRPIYDLSEAERRDDLVGLAAVVPTIIAALARLAAGLEPVAPDPALGYVADYLRMIRGDEAPAEFVDALSVYLVAAIDHGFNASTFTSRVIASTGADAAACLVGGLGALSGPLHGGAPSRALDTLDAIGDPSRTDEWIAGELEAGRRIMGFGHPVYRTEDPRSALLKRVAQRFGGPRVELAVQVEERIPVLLEQLKHGRALHTNLEWYAGVVMEIAGLDRELFTSTFAAARVLGWTANVLEQARDPKIIRPSARYVGPPPVRG
ncbi:citrate/2-methylcitrate synthase [Frondihabitans australicus]|uniref:Citrate synthase n=1 Tax=Frondihabitans australicus TaxID=386892 RepID=A0A495IIE8_9MICO|nr:citrate/2-methylcitrate synthase [Frondihabitans australicus]RKR75763.1 citrate synthase [Frondihabitans australicus]